MTIHRLKDGDSGDRVEQLRFTVLVVLPGTIMLLMLERLLWPGGPFLLFLPLDIALLTLLSRLIWPLINHASHGLINTLTSAGGEAHSVEYSEVEALVIQGRHVEAQMMYRAIAEELPDNTEVRLRLGDLLMAPQTRDHVGATAAFLSARGSAPSRVEESRIANALIDLYRHTGNREGMKAELLRFARLHEGSPAGAQAREAVKRMLAEEG